MKDPKILVYDIETTPIQAYVWGTYQTDVIKVIEPSAILCFGYHWLGSPDPVMVVSRPQFKRAYARNLRDDYRVVAELHKLFDEADVVVAHNGNSFDQKKTNARFLYHQLPAPSPYHQVDTMRVARSNFKHESNRLDALGRLLGIGGKEETGGFSTWEGCMAGDLDAWDRMETYCARDVEMLEEVYLRLRDGGWIKNHPNLANIADRLASCPRCLAAGSHLMKRGLVHTKTASYQQYQCGACNSFVRERKGNGPRFV